MKIHIFGSSSSGNSLLVKGERDSFLIDIGIGVKSLSKHLELHKLTLEALSGAFISHLHSDHLNEITFQKLLSLNSPLYFHNSVYDFIDQSNVGLFSSIQFIDGAAVSLNEFEISSFEVPHDSNGGCYGFNVISDKYKISIATDLGSYDDKIIEKLLDSDVLIVEANYDPESLHNSNRPYLLKNRISGDMGHLSNFQSAELINTVLKNSAKAPKKIVLAHLSRECNSEKLALKTVGDKLERNGFINTDLSCADNYKPTNFFEI